MERQRKIESRLELCVGNSPIEHYLALCAWVTPLEPGFAKVRIAPHPSGIRHLRGVVPTGKGQIMVEIDGDELKFDLPVPVEVIRKGKWQQQK